MILFSCSKPEKVQYYPNGKFQKTYLKGDSIYVKDLDKNGDLKSEGKFYKGQKVGKWKYYNAEGGLEKIFEYKNISGLQYTNQGWHFNREGDTIKEEGNYYKLQPFTKSVKPNEAVRLHFFYKGLFSKSNIYVCVHPKLNEDFSNIDSTKLDTIFTNSNEFTINMAFRRPGKKNIRGFISEFENSKREDSIVRYIYFDIPITVR